MRVQHILFLLFSLSFFQRCSSFFQQEPHTMSGFGGGHCLPRPLSAVILIIALFDAIVALLASFQVLSAFPLSLFLVYISLITNLGFCFCLIVGRMEDRCIRNAAWGNLRDFRELFEISKPAFWKFWLFLLLDYFVADFQIQLLLDASEPF